MIYDIGKDTIDFSKVERVGGVGGDPSWLRYSVYFTGGDTFEIYEERVHVGGFGVTQMKRVRFIELWKQSKQLS